MATPLAALAGAVVVRPRGWTAAAGSALLLLAAGAANAQVLINPVIVELGASQRVASVMVTLSDKALAPMRLQADVLVWEQNLQGGEVTRQTTDLLVTPPIVDLQPGQKQLFRIAPRGARKSAQELAYRLILEDVAPAPQPAEGKPEGMAINFRMRYDLPVLIAPAAPVLNVLSWAPCSRSTASDSEPACVRLRNSGNRRVKVQTLTVSGDAWQQSIQFAEGITVLAGAEREWRFPLERGHAGPLRRLQVLTARGETLQAEPRND